MLLLWFPPLSRAHVIALNGCPGSVKKNGDFEVLYILRHLTVQPGAGVPGVGALSSRSEQQVADRVRGAGPLLTTRRACDYK